MYNLVIYRRKKKKQLFSASAIFDFFSPYNLIKDSKYLTEQQLTSVDLVKSQITFQISCSFWNIESMLCHLFGLQLSS